MMKLIYDIGSDDCIFGAYLIPFDLSSLVYSCRFYFQSLQSNDIFYNILVRKCPSSIRHRDSNIQPLDYESPPLTTRPGLPSMNTLHLLLTASWSPIGSASITSHMLFECSKATESKQLKMEPSS